MCMRWKDVSKISSATDWMIITSMTAEEDLRETVFRFDDCLRLDLIQICLRQEDRKNRREREEDKEKYRLR